MRRADRLFELLQLLRGGRLRTADDLGRRLEVSPRTVYRDIADLQARGVPIDGQRGVGYLLRPSHFLPPLTLSETELEALRLGVRFVEAHGDEALADAARELSVKIEAVLPAGRVPPHDGVTVIAGPRSRAFRDRLAVVRTAIGRRRKLRLAYADAGGVRSDRTVRPLGLEFWGQVWTCTGWCELREDFRVFRVDRMLACEPTGERFRDEAGKRLSDYLADLDAKGAP